VESERRPWERCEAKPTGRIRDVRDNAGPVNDLAGLRRIVSGLAADGILTWVFGGWAEELRRLAPPRQHRDIDLLYPGSDFRPVDRLIEHRRLQAIPAKRFAHKRALVMNDVMVELFLVRTDEDGASYTMFWERLRYDWPRDVLWFVDGVAVASASALRRYRADHAAVRRAAAP